MEAWAKRETHMATVWLVVTVVYTAGVMALIYFTK